MAINKYLSIITLNVNELNSPIKIHRVAKQKRNDPHTCCQQETHLRTKYIHKLKVKGWKKIFHTNGQEKKAGVTILISEEIDFKTKTITRDKEGHFIILKGIVQQEDITLISIYAPNIGAPKYIKKILETLRKWETVIQSSQGFKHSTDSNG